MPKEKSISRFSSSRCFGLSVRIEQASALVSVGVSGGTLSGFKIPSSRIWGAELVVRWRSDPPCSTIDFSSWFSVGGMTTYLGSREIGLYGNSWPGVYTMEEIDERA